MIQIKGHDEHCGSMKARAPYLRKVSNLRSGKADATEFYPFSATGRCFGYRSSGTSWLYDGRLV